MAYYSAKHKDEKVQRKSSSGGAFTAISDVVLEEGGVIFAADYDYPNHRMVHRIARTKEERDAQMGSKYIQSDTNEIFRILLDTLKKEDGTPCLFVGTPCQVAGLKSFLAAKKVNTDRLYLCDLICHGVGSAKVYRDCLPKGKEEPIDFVTFKDKRLGWKQPLAFVRMGNKEKSLRKFTLLYFGNVVMRPSCYVCPYANTQRVGDITLGDHWGVERCDPEFYDKNGVSLVLTNNEKGEALLQKASSGLHIKERTKAECLQPNLVKSAKPYIKRAEFWKEYVRHPKRTIWRFDMKIAMQKVKQRLRH